MNSNIYDKMSVDYGTIEHIQGFRYQCSFLFTAKYNLNSKHDCIRDDLLVLPTQKYAEVLQAHLVHIVAFLRYILMVQNPEGKRGVIEMSMNVDPT